MSIKKVLCEMFTLMSPVHDAKQNILFCIFCFGFCVVVGFFFVDLIMHSDINLNITIVIFLSIQIHPLFFLFYFKKWKVGKKSYFYLITAVHEKKL